MKKYIWLKYLASTNKLSSFIWYNIFRILPNNKNVLLIILTLLITTDIILTTVFVIFYNAIEINPLCISFLSFMIMKIITSYILLYIAIQIKNTPGWISFIIILISIYSGLLFFNLNNIINYLFK
jgi:hypothetical protein